LRYSAGGSALRPSASGGEGGEHGEDDGSRLSEHVSNDEASVLPELVRDMRSDSDTHVVQVRRPRGCGV
jgi:hypothetical protein